MTAGASVDLSFPLCGTNMRDVQSNTRSSQTGVEALEVLGHAELKIRATVERRRIEREEKQKAPQKAEKACQAVFCHLSERQGSNPAHLEFLQGYSS